MAFASDSTTTPELHRALLTQRVCDSATAGIGRTLDRMCDAARTAVEGRAKPARDARGRFCKRSDLSLLAPADDADLDDAIRALLADAGTACQPCNRSRLEEKEALVSTAPEPLLPAADLARDIHLRRQLEAAAEHGAAMLAALGLPRLVGPDFTPLDLVAAGDALDLAIATLDALDARDEDREPYLAGSYNEAVDPTGEAEDDSDESEDTALERHGRGFVRAGEDDAEDDDPAEDSDPAERDDEHGSEDAEDIGHHANRHDPRPLRPADREAVAIMAARAAQVRRVLHA